VAATLVTACGTPYLAKDEGYPADWPDLAEIGRNCQGIAASFENKGVLSDGRGRRREVWLTDLELRWWSSNRLTKDQLEAAAPLRACERLRLSLDQFEPDWLHPNPFNFRLVVYPARRSASGLPDQFEPCRSYSMPSPGEQASGVCFKNSFQLIPDTTGGLLGADSIFGLASDGSLIVNQPGVGSWARFNRVP